MSDNNDNVFRAGLRFKTKQRHRLIKSKKQVSASTLFYEDMHSVFDNLIAKLADEQDSWAVNQRLLYNPDSYQPELEYLIGVSLDADSALDEAIEYITEVIRLVYQEQDLSGINELIQFIEQVRNLVGRSV